MGCFLRVVFCVLFVVCCSSCLMFALCCSFFNSRCLVVVVLVFGVCFVCSLFFVDLLVALCVVRCWLLVVCGWLFVVCCLLFVVCCLLFVVCGLFVVGVCLLVVGFCCV